MLPLIEVSVEPLTAADRDKLGAALVELAAADEGFDFHTDGESGQTIMSGQAEWQLDQKINALREVYGLDVTIGAPQVAYRETITRRIEIDFTHKTQVGGAGQFARVKVVFEPAEPGEGYTFAPAVPPGNIPDELLPGVEKGLAQAKENGLLAGFPVIDFKATLIDGDYHDVDSSVLAFEIAARAAFAELRDKAQPVLLEPIMRIEITTPAEYASDIVADLNLRRSQNVTVQTREGDRMVRALTPLANLFGYLSTLRHLSQGLAEFVTTFDQYGLVPLAAPDPYNFPPAMAKRA
jgi:elongation factor G